MFEIKNLSCMGLISDWKLQKKKKKASESEERAIK